MTPARRPVQPAAALVLPIERLRIERALARRSRYRYVQPRVQAEDGGWAVRSPNCSRSIDPQGGEIPIAWLAPAGARWQLHARDHAAGAWVPCGPVLPLHRALDLLCADPNREFWP